MLLLMLACSGEPVKGPDDTSVPADTDLTDTDDTAGTDDTADTDDTATTAPVPDFALVDLNLDSARYGEVVSPRDYLERVSGWYFIHST